MWIFVGPWAYWVLVTTEPLIGDDGAAQIGRAVYLTRTICISSDVPPQGRLDLLLHEATHSFLFHFAKPRTEEETCNFSATVTASVWRDLERQGGERALMRLKPNIKAPKWPRSASTFDFADRYQSATATRKRKARKA